LKVLVLGNAVFRLLADSPGFEVAGTARSAGAMSRLRKDLREKMIAGVDVEHFDSLARAFALARPVAVINCIGLVKQLAEADDPLAALPINARLQHRLARLFAVAGARLVHVCTDCVFLGTRGLYRESDAPDAQDLYGRSKLLGEVDYPKAITLRTSIVGHELGAAHGLVGWFLAQSGEVRGYTRAIFSGLPTVELATVIRPRLARWVAARGVSHGRGACSKIRASEAGRSPVRARHAHRARRARGDRSLARCLALCAGHRLRSTRLARAGQTHARVRLSADTPNAPTRNSLHVQ
jgi:dTDP-4-dehydrorhamnose reductase